MRDSDNSVVFTVKRIKNLRSVRIAVHSDGRCVVSANVGMNQQQIEIFVQTHKGWIEKKREMYEKKAEKYPKIPLIGEYSECKSDALDMVIHRLQYWNQFYGYSWNRVSIRNQISRWGSCSSGRNLSFNYRIILLPDHIADYIIVHELCHLAQMNHSQRFWDLVAVAMPEYRDIQKQLHQYSLTMC
jgi:predicted metal-dependent hydrolase